MPAPEDVIALIERFEQNREAYLSGQYNETQLRREFLDPLFTALGWDVDNKQGYAEAYKDVIHEDALKIGSAVKAPDYCFRIGGTRKFFVEAKKPSVNLKADINPAFQLRRYAWSAKLPLSILTDFEEFAVYDCRVKPVKTDKASTARILYMTYKEYAQRWDEISSVFTRDAVLKGSFDKYAEKGRHKKGTAEVDAAFLSEIESWRDILARNIALRNEGLTQRELNFSVQRTIDRIIFLRICEDRGIEEYGRLMALLNGTNVYKRLFQIFRNADERYNSGLFHFEKEKDRHEFPDDLTPSLDIDDKILKEMIGRLYYPESPYEFSVLPADILGQVYEQFLGKVIRLTEGHRAIVEEKPEVRKAGGVYYTPTYIVDYIVKNTVGVLVGAGPCACQAVESPVGAALALPSDNMPASTKPKKGAASSAPTISQPITPKEVSKIRILDPACGSGSFLLGAYQYLLDYHRDWYASNDPQKWATGRNPAIYQSPNWRLTTAERKRILLNNIYGVDIDSQAVEVTKLSLLLKVLEGENNQTLERQMKFFHERALPDLGDNIKCGNSLIGPDFYDMDLLKSAEPHFNKGGQGGILDEEERYRINVFDWYAEFPEIMKAGGFDAVIGNPPWGADFSLQEQPYLRTCYQVARGGNIDSYAVFMEQSLNRLKPSGLLGYITPDTFLRKNDHVATRKVLLENNRIINLIETGPVFSKVRDTWCLVSITEKAVPSLDSKIQHKKISRFIVSAEERLEKFGRREWDFQTEVFQSVWKKRPQMVLGYLATEAAQDLIAKIEKYPSLKDLSAEYRISRGEEGSKFALEENEQGDYCIVIPEDVERFHVAKGKRVSGEKLTTNKVKHYYTHPKIWIIRIQKMRWTQRIVSGLDERNYSAGMKTLQVIVSTNDDVNALKYLQGIMASKLINFWCCNYLADDMNQSYLERIPIRLIDHVDHADKIRHDKMVSLVEQMLSLNKQLTSAKTAHEKTSLQRQIDATDNLIDKLVYELYGLTEEEIRIVENGL